MLIAERGRLPSRVARSDGARSGECMSAKRGTVPRDGVRRPPGGALPIRPWKSSCALSRRAACGGLARECALCTCSPRA